MTIKTLNNKSLSETIIDWFERNPTSSMRSAPLAKAIKVSPDRVADGLWRLADQGKLVKCKVVVGDSERTKGAPKTQWEYKLPAGAFALPEVKPLKVAKPYRRQPEDGSVTLAGSGSKTPAVSEPVSLVEGGTHDTDSAPVADTVVEQPAQDESLVPAGSDENEVGNLRFMLAMIETALKPEPDEGFVPAIKRLQNRAERAESDLESILSANRKFCGYVADLVGNTKYPINLYECQNIISEMIGDMIEDSAAIIATKDVRIALLEGNASLPLENAPKQASTAVIKDFLTTESKESDPNGKRQSEAGAKLDAGKNRMGLVLCGFARALQEVGAVGTYGANKYTDNGWIEVPDGERRYTDAMLRHLMREATGEVHDPDTGLHHAAHAAWNALARLDIALRRTEHDRQTEFKNAA